MLNKVVSINNGLELEKYNDFSFPHVNSDISNQDRVDLLTTKITELFERLSNDPRYYLPAEYMHGERVTARILLPRDIIINGVTLREIPIYSLSFNPSFLFPGNKGFVQIAGMGEMYYKFQEIASLLRGNEIEEIPPLIETDRIIKPDKFWSDWSKKAVDGVSEFAVYPQNIDPIVKGIVLNAIKSLTQPEKRLVVVDIFGGYGRLLGDIAKEVFGNKDIQFVLIDKNENNISEGKILLGAYNSLQIKADLTENKIVLEDFIGRKPDIVTCVGGLAHQVVTKQEAKNIAQKVFHSLNSGGFFILSGMSQPLLLADDYLKIGFEVLNMGVPHNIFSLLPSKPDYLYVLRKP